MAEVPREAEPLYSNRLMMPWLAVLRERPEVPRSAIAEFEALDPDGRMPATLMVKLAKAAVALTGDPDLGLKAAQAATMGDYDVLEYAANSASSTREAMDIVVRYISLVNDGLDLRMELHDGRLHFRARSAVQLDRATADYQSAAFHVTASRWRGGKVVVREVWHQHAEPEDLSEYRKVYGDATLRFGEPFEGMVYDAGLLDEPMETANPSLHHVLRRHAEQMLATMPRLKTTGEQVRLVLIETLSSGLTTAESVAGRLHMSRRTMTRRLEEEGTSYKELLDEVRQQLAVGYLTDTSMSVGEVAFLLGFSQGPAFHRAFKRWTGRTPIEYRRERRAG